MCKLKLLDNLKPESESESESNNWIHKWILDFLVGLVPSGSSIGFCRMRPISEVLPHLRLLDWSELVISSNHLVTLFIFFTLSIDMTWTWSSSSDLAFNINGPHYEYCYVYVPSPFVWRSHICYMGFYTT